MNLFGEAVSNEMSSNENIFKRDTYREVQSFLKSEKIFCLLAGPRKVGKTFLLNQLCLEYNILYFDFKEDYDKASQAFYNLDLSQDIYIFDEITYLKDYDKELINLANRYTETLANGYEVKAKIIISGSQSVALQYFADLYFASNITIIKMGFLSYTEFLRWKNIVNSRNSFNDFLQNSWKFHGINSNRAYLRACLHETVKSCDNSFRQIPELRFIDDESILEVTQKLLYMIVFKLHVNASWQRMVNLDKIFDNLSGDYRRTTGKKSPEELKEAFSETLAYKALSATKITFPQLKNALLFLIKSGLVIFNFDLADDITVVMQWLNNKIELHDINSTLDFFKKYNVIIKYPLFYLNVINDVLENGKGLESLKLSEFINTDVLGSIYECYIKGIYANKQDCDYVRQWEETIDGHTHQIDLVTDDCELIELSVGEKPDSSTHFKFFPDQRYKKLIVCNGELPKAHYERISYWDFAYDI